MYLRSESGRENISAGGTVVSIKDEINKIQQKPPANQPYRKEGVPHPARRGRNAWAFLTVLGSLTPELPESPEGALFFAQILKLHIAYMRIYGV